MGKISTARIDLCMVRSSSLQAQHLPVLTTGKKRDVAGGSAHFQCRTAAVQIPFSSGSAGSPLTALRCNSNLGKIRADTMAVGQIDRRANRNVQTRRQVNRYVARGSLKHGVSTLTSGNELGHDAACSGFRLGCSYP